MVAKQCKICNRNFNTYFINQIYCSQKCMGISRQKLELRGKCLICNKVFIRNLRGTRRQKFCSRKCYLKYHFGYEIIICKKCNKKFGSFKSNERKFCSKKCKISFFKRENHPLWQGGISNLPYSFDFNNDLKEQIRKRDNYQCQNKECNMTEEEHLIVYGKVLSIHHINYNKQDCNENNLISLCIQCNFRVNHNRNYWKKYFKDLILTN